VSKPIEDRLLGHFYSELRRRRVLATLSIQVIAAWLIIQVTDALFPGWNIAEENIRFLLYATIACFPIAFVFGWKYDITPRGIKVTLPASRMGDDGGLPPARSGHVLLSFLSLATISIFVGFGRGSPTFDCRESASKTIRCVL